MAEHDPADVEYMARLICVAMCENPDRMTLQRASCSAHKDKRLPVWKTSNMQARAIRALDYMAARGEKVTTPRD